MLKRDWKQTTRFLCSLMMVLLMGCAQDNSLIEPRLSPESGGLGFRDESPNLNDDCRCFMQVRSVNNSPNEGLFDGWYLGDITGDGPGYEEEGRPTQWLEIGVGYHDFPAPSRELNIPSNGWHSFWLIGQVFSSNLPPSDDFQVNTIVRCFQTNLDGSLGPLMTTTYHSFRWGDGGAVVQGENPPYWTRVFNRQFSCNVLPAGPGPG